MSHANFQLYPNPFNRYTKQSKHSNMVKELQISFLLYSFNRFRISSFYKLTNFTIFGLTFFQLYNNTIHLYISKGLLPSCPKQYYMPAILCSLKVAKKLTEKTYFAVLDQFVCPLIR
jgi:hypothetical protein